MIYKGRFQDISQVVERMHKGLHDKYIVRRTDGSSEEGGKHYGCQYFVLDLNHDPHAIPALEAYAESCKHSHPELSEDLLSRIARMKSPGQSND